MMKVLYVAVIACLLSSSAYAGRYSWEFAGWYGGGAFPHLTFDPNNKNRVYLTSDVAGLWRSEDLGEHWYFITRGLGNLMVAQVAVAPSDPNVLYAATKGGVFVSRNAGASWQGADTAKGALVFERPANYRPLVIDGQNPAKLCAGTAKGVVLCSENYGASWVDIDASKKYFNQPKPITALALDGRGNLFVSGSHGLMRCAVNGTSCENLNLTFTVTDFVLSSKNQGLIYAAGEAQLWISPDTGKTWQRTQPVAQGKTYRVVADESGAVPVIRVAWNDGWKGGVVSSHDSGTTWGQGNGAMNGDTVGDPTRVWADKNGKLTGLFVDPFDHNVLFRTDWWGVWRSDDGAKTWNEKIIGAANTVATDAAFSPDRGLFVASMDNGLLKSKDLGKSYHALFPTKWDPARSGHVWRVGFAGTTLVATSSPWEQRLNQVILSNDGGETFELIRAGLPVTRPNVNTMWGEGYPRALAIHPKNPDIIYLGIDGDDGGGLFVSRDRGKTWERSAGQPGSLRVYRGLKVDPRDPRRIIWGACGNNGGVYISTDAGMSFVHSLKQLSWVFDLDVASDGTIFAAGDNGGAKLYVSNDHGRSWKLTGEFSQGRALASVVVDPRNPKRVAVSTANWGNEAPCRIFLSSNGGRSWKDITGDLPDGAGASSMTFDPQGNYLYITRYAGSVYRLKL